MRTVEIDVNSGFCFGVVTAISKAEKALEDDCDKPLYCLGDIVHNSAEVKRLELKGMITISHKGLDNLPSGATVLLRAHGEPPATYELARQHGINILDATCPVVLKLQDRINHSYREALNSNRCRQIVIYGKPGHAEVNGLVGQTDGTAIVIQGVEDMHRLDFTHDIDLYSQTTMSVDGFENIISEIKSRIKGNAVFTSHDTICRQVANRVHHLRRFAASHSVVVFVSGAKSSNGKFLFNECLKVNPQTIMISNETELDEAAFKHADSIGICGATSTPRWLMDRVKDKIEQLTAQ